MTSFESTRNIRHAIQSVIPLRPAPVGNRRLVRFLALALVSLLVVLLALNLFSAIGAPRPAGIALAIGWMLIVGGGAPITLWLRRRDEKNMTRRFADWESDSRRLSIDRLGLDLAAGRLPRGLKVQDVHVLEGAATDWRHGREALESISSPSGELGQIRDDLRRQMDEAMTNLLAEAGAGSPLGLSPFAIERARNLFQEIGGEANQIAGVSSSAGKFATDTSIEAMRFGLDRLRTERIARMEGEVFAEPVASREDAA